jgi:hypothetical protein
MNLYLISIWIDEIILVLSPILLKVDRNPIFGLRIPATLSDSEIWKKTHEKLVKISRVPTLIHLFLVLLTHKCCYSYIKIFDALLWFSFMLLLLYCIYYANTLYEDKFLQDVKKVNSPKLPLLKKLSRILMKLNPGFVKKVQLWI